MQPFLNRHVVWPSIPLGLILGCGQSEKPPEQLQTTPTTISTQELPKLGDYLPPLDDGRIELAPPEGWHVPGRSSKWIARFQRDTAAQYPSIVITAEDYESLLNVSQNNLEEFADQTAAAESVSSVKPIQVDRFVGVTYRKRGIEKDSINKILERLFLVTVVAGRKYTLELRTREGMLGEGQPCLLAVAGGIKFPAARQRLEEEPRQQPEQDAGDEARVGPVEKAGNEEADVDSKGLEDSFK